MFCAVPKDRERFAVASAEVPADDVSVKAAFPCPLPVGRSVREPPDCAGAPFRNHSSEGAPPESGKENGAAYKSASAPVMA